MIPTLLLAVIVERVTEIITSSEISNIIFKNRLKGYLFGDAPLPNTPYNSILKFIDKLTSCGFCCSVWVSGAVNVYTDAYFNDWLLDTFLVFGLSNLYHVLYELLRRGRINTYDHNVTFGGKVDVKGIEQARGSIDN